jgi:predicted metal-dependent enzyme (double-stranded beta helix superfamily)
MQNIKEVLLITRLIIFFTMYLFFISGKLVTPIHHLVIIVVAIFVGGIDEIL